MQMTNASNWFQMSFPRWNRAALLEHLYAEASRLGLTLQHQDLGGLINVTIHFTVKGSLENVEAYTEMVKEIAILNS